MNALTKEDVQWSPTMQKLYVAASAPRNCVKFREQELHCYVMSVYSFDYLRVVSKVNHIYLSCEH